MYDQEQQTKRLFGSDQTMGLFVALYLILLAFFIMLNAVSEQTAVKAEAAMTSVNQTFQEIDRPQNQLTIDPAADDEPSNDVVLTQIRRAFLAEMNLPGRFSSAGGNVFEVQFPSDNLFQKGSFRVKSNMIVFLDQLIEVVRNAPDGKAQQVAFMFGTGAGPVAREMTRAQEIAVRRAGSIARYMRSKGVADGLYTIGFVAIPEDQILAAFHSATTNTVRRS